MRSILFIIAVFGLVGCSGLEAKPPTATLADLEEIDATWLLLRGSVDGSPVPMPAKARTTIRFTGAEFGGHAACNSYGGGVRFVGNAVAFGEISQTMVGCAGEFLESEQTFITSLRGVSAIGFDGDELVLAGPGIELRFTRLAEAQPDEFVDRQWVLASLVHDGKEVPPGGLPVTLQIGSDGTFSGTTGCRTFRGTWIACGDQIGATAMEMGDADCPAALQAQDGHVVQVIDDGVIPTVDGDELTLSDVNGDALIYRAAAD